MANLATCLSISLFIFKFEIKSVKRLCYKDFVIFKKLIKMKFEDYFWSIFGLIKTLQVCSILITI